LRPRGRNALELLAYHYTPNAVKVSLELSLLGNEQPAAQALQGFTKKMLWRWLRNRFEAIDISSVHLKG
jgi:hypothetical protein